jgi:hypothetical protein
MVYFLYFVEGHPGLPVQRPFADQIAGYMFGFRQVIIDPNKAFHEEVRHFPLVLRSFEQAREHPLLRDLTWVFLDPYGTVELKDFKHPTEDVIYCFGSDWNGFGEDVVPLGATVRVDLPGNADPGSRREFFASTLLPIVAYDRVLKRHWGGE